MPAARWRNGARWVELNARFASSQERLSREDQEDLRIPEGGTPGWIEFNLWSGMDLNENISLRFSVMNLFDRNYREHMSGFNAPGRNFILSGDIKF